MRCSLLGLLLFAASSALAVEDAGVPSVPDAGVPQTWTAIARDAINVSPGRTLDEVFDALRAAEPDVATCLRASPITSSAGVTMTIEASGLVARVDASAEAALAACLKLQLLAVRFKPADTQQTVKVKLRPEKRVLGSMDKQIIRRIVNEHALTIRHCYEKELTRTPGIAGKIKMKWVIGADGLVTQGSVESDAMGSEAVTACLIEAIKTWKFPKPKGGGIVIVSYPFVFRQSR